MFSIKKQLKNNRYNISQWNISDEAQHINALLKASQKNLSERKYRAALRKKSSSLSKWALKHQTLSQVILFIILLCFLTLGAFLLKDHKTVFLALSSVLFILFFAGMYLVQNLTLKMYPKIAVSRIWDRHADFVYKNHFSPPNVSKKHFRSKEQLKYGLNKAIEHKKQFRKFPATVIAAIILYVGLSSKLPSNNSGVVISWVRHLDLLAWIKGIFSIFLSFQDFDTLPYFFTLIFMGITFAIWYYILVPLGHLEFLKQSLEPLLERTDKKNNEVISSPPQNEGKK